MKHQPDDFSPQIIANAAIFWSACVRFNLSVQLKVISWVVYSHFALLETANVFVLSRRWSREEEKKVVNTTACRSTGDVYQEASSSIEVALGMCAAVPAQSDLIRSHKLWTASTSRLCNLRQGFVVVPAFLNENKNKLTQLRSPIEK